jgi:hypothetical protein
MNLTDAQKQAVAAWINEGLKLADIQKRLGTEFGLNLTYMEVRFLVDDLKLTLKEEPKPPPPAAPKAGPSAGQDKTPATPAGPATTGVSVTVDQIARPGAVVSGSVRFSDGETAVWYMDQMGRLGLGPKKQGYKPSAADIQSFQAALDSELARLGM